MALSLGDVVRITWIDSYAGQIFQNGMNYVKETNDFVPVSDTVELQNLANALAAGGSGSILNLMLATLPTNLTVSYVQAQKIRPLSSRSIAMFTPIVAAGTFSAVAETGNIGSTIQFNTVLGGRNQRSSWHLPALPNGVAANGSIPAGTFLTAFQALAARLINLITAGLGATYIPIILHGPPATFSWDYIAGAFAHTTVRTMRRRTVGVGK